MIGIAERCDGESVIPESHDDRPRPIGVPATFDRAEPAIRVEA